MFCSKGYFVSPNCMRELLRAAVLGKPTFALLDPEATKGGLTRAEIEEQLRAADAPCEKGGTHYPTKYAMWYAKRCL